MSGPKMSAYEVEQNRLLDLRACQDTLRRAAALTRTLTSLIESGRREQALNDQAVASLSVRGVPDEAEGLGVARAYEDQIRAKLSETQRLVRLGGLRRDTSSLLASAAAKLRVHTSGLNASPAPRTAEALAAQPPLLDSLRARAQSLLDRLPDEVTPEEQSRALRSLGELRDTADAPRALQLLAILNAIVQEANDRARKTRAGREEAQELLRRLDGLASPAIQQLRGQLYQVTTHGTEIDETLRQAVAQAAAQGKRDADREYVAEMVGKAFRSLGYEVRAGFQTLVVEDGVAYCDRPDAPGYAVRVRLSAEKPTMDLDVVRTNDGTDRSAAEQAVRDREVEEAFCGVHDAIVAETQRHGLKLKVVRRLKAGARPMPTIGTGTAPTATPAHRPRATPLRGRKLDG